MEKRMFMKWKVIMGVTVTAMVLAAGAVIAAAPYVASAQGAATATAAPGTASSPPNAGGPQGGDTLRDLPGLQEIDLLNSAAARATGLTVPDVISPPQAGRSP